MKREFNSRANRDRVLVSLTGAMSAWLEQASETKDLRLPWIGHSTDYFMARAALAVLEATDDLYASAVEDGLIKEEF